MTTCNEAINALVGLMERDETLTPEVREHIRSCASCSRVIDTAKEIGTVEDEVPRSVHVEEIAARAGDVVESRRRWRRAVVAWGTAIVLITFALVAMRSGLDDTVEAAGGIAMLFLFILAVISAVSLPLLLIAWLVQRFFVPRVQLYKRLRPGYQLSGVCLGLSETTGINVFALRVLFFVLIFFDGIGLWAYILLDLIMPVHPDDRQHLLRFRLARAWRRRFGNEA